MINLARVMSNPAELVKLMQCLDGLPLHEEILSAAQGRLREREANVAVFAADHLDLFAKHSPERCPVVLAQPDAWHFGNVSALEGRRRG